MGYTYNCILLRIEGTSKLLNFSTPQLLNSSTSQPLSSSTPKPTLIESFTGFSLFLIKLLLMAQPLKYMVDEKGQKTSVLVPLTTWTKMNDDFTKLQGKLKVLLGIQSAFTEVKSASKTGKQLQTLKDFKN